MRLLFGSSGERHVTVDSVNSNSKGYSDYIALCDRPVLHKGPDLDRQIDILFIDSYMVKTSYKEVAQVQHNKPVRGTCAMGLVSHPKLQSQNCREAVGVEHIATPSQRLQREMALGSSSLSHSAASFTDMIVSLTEVAIALALSLPSMKHHQRASDESRPTI